MADRLDRHACVLGAPRSRRDDHPVRTELVEAGDVGHVVADDERIRTKFTEVLDEVVDEAVVIIDDDTVAHARYR